MKMLCRSDLSRVRAEINSLESEGYSFEGTTYFSDGREFIFIHSRNYSVIRIFCPNSHGLPRLYKNGVFKKVI